MLILINKLYYIIICSFCSFCLLEFTRFAWFGVYWESPSSVSHEVAEIEDDSCLCVLLAIPFEIGTLDCCVLSVFIDDIDIL